MKRLLIVIAACTALLCGIAGLSACSAAPTYSVACSDCQNGYVIASDTRVEAGEKVILAAHPSAGYKLAAFLVDGEVIDGVSFVMPDKDVVVSAQFEIITYSVTYVVGDAVVVGSNPDSYTVETASELIEPQKDGYEICGWYTHWTELDDDDYFWGSEDRNEDNRVKTLEGLYGNLTLYAKYYNPLHEITEAECFDGWFYVEDGIWRARYHDTVSVFVEPSRGYELDHVAVNGEAIDGTSFEMPACDIEISVNFKPIVYTITYELDGGDNSPDNPEYYTVEDGEDGNITIHDAQKDGYTFIYWYYYEDDYEMILNNSLFDTNLCRSVTLYAYFYPNDEYDEIY